MPSHLTPEEERPSSVSELDLKGNSWADTKAGDIAREVALPLNVSALVIYYYHLIERVQKRLTTIITLLPGRPKHKRAHVPKMVKPSLDTLIAQSNHVAYIQGSRVKCARCLNSFNKHDTTVSHFLATSCSARGSSSDRPVPMKHESIHIGRRTIHHSHSIHTFRGLIYCNNCGMRSSTELHNLNKQCMPPTEYGMQTKLALSNGKLPPKLTRWPDELPKASEQSAVSKSISRSKRTFMPKGIPWPW